MGKKRSAERRYVIRYTGELDAREVIIRLLKLAAGETGPMDTAAREGGRWRRDEETRENRQGGGICQDKQG